MLGMDASVEMGPTEGAVLALLDFLVDPLLPARSSSREAITPAQEELVAKQVDHPDVYFILFAVLGVIAANAW